MIQRRLKLEELSSDTQKYAAIHRHMSYWSDTAWSLHVLDAVRQQNPEYEYRVVTVVKDEKRSHKKKATV
jgi:hypothetical protein